MNYLTNGDEANSRGVLSDLFQAIIEIYGIWYRSPSPTQHVVYIYVYWLTKQVIS